MKKIFVLLFSLFSLGSFAQTEQLIRQITFDLGKVEGSLLQINMLAKKGEITQAKSMVDDALIIIDTIEKNQQLAVQLDGSIDDETLMLKQTQELKRYLVNKANFLRNAINIYIQCDADCFGSSYPALQNAIKGQLSPLGCSFTDKAEEADWLIVISAKAREAQKSTIGEFTSYYAYVDSYISINKQATKQKVYEDEISTKGGDTRNYKEAARVAFKDTVTKLSEIIKTQIAQ